MGSGVSLVPITTQGSGSPLRCAFCRVYFGCTFDTRLSVLRVLIAELHTSQKCVMSNINNVDRWGIQVCSPHIRMHTHADIQTHRC